MIFSLDVRRARKGDCFLLHLGTPADRGLIVIDGGPSQVYQPFLRPRLAALRTARALADADPLPIDMLMVSHIDDDHIAGVLELTGELVEAQRARRPPAFKIRRLWHNSFDDIIGNDPAHLLAAITAHFGPAALTGSPDVEGLSPDAAQVLASVTQGLQLRDDAVALKLKVNPEFDSALVMAAKKAAAVDAGHGLTFRIVGPMKPDLSALQKEHDAFLKAHASKPKTALASFTDTSVPNLSSIVALAECGGKRILLTGDARGDKILEGLELSGVVQPSGAVHVDVLKMPHHGSDRNMTRPFLERVTADHYVFSGNGEHGNPERATLEMLREARGDAEAYTIHLTYPVDEIDAAREVDWNKERDKEKARAKKSPGTHVRAAWSAQTNALGAFFAAHDRFAKKVSIVDPKTPHLIELLDPAAV